MKYFLVGMMLFGSMACAGSKKSPPAQTEAEKVASAKREKKIADEKATAEEQKKKNAKDPSFGQ